MSPPEIPRPPRRPSHVDPEEVSVGAYAVFEDEPPSRSSGDRSGHLVLRAETEERLVRALKTLESIPPLQKATSDKVDTVSVELMKLAHQHQLDGQRRDLQAERNAERVARLEQRVDVLEGEGGSSLRKQLDTALAAQTHWVRYAVTAVIAFISGGVLLAIARLIR